MPAASPMIVSAFALTRTNAGSTSSIPIGPRSLDPSAGGDYSQLPWRLGLLRQTNSPC